MRKTIDRLEAYMWAVTEEDTLVTDDHGNVIHDALGVPKTVKRTLMVFVDPQTGHEVHVPWSDEGKAGLLKALTGGVIVAKANDLPKARVEI